MDVRHLHWLHALREPERVVSWSLADWEFVVRLARRLRLLGRLAECIDQAGLDNQIPRQVHRQLVAERRQSRARTRGLMWTLDHVGQALSGAIYPRVLLKGAAYLAQQLPNAVGRLPSDLDILIPKQHLPDAQQRLRDREWQEAELDTHDQRYYRDWSHEIPPMRHGNFSLELDVHHGILPPVASQTVDPALLLSRLMSTGLAGWSVLSPVDQWIHCAVHLLLDSDLRDRLRDLVDLDALGRHFGQRPGFWDELLERSTTLDLAEPVALAIHYTSAWLQTPVPAEVSKCFDRLGPRPFRRAWLLPMLDAVLWPAPPDERVPWRQSVASTALLAKYHWGRMPLRLLVPHLWHKARAGRTGDGDGTQ